MASMSVHLSNAQKMENKSALAISSIGKHRVSSRYGEQISDFNNLLEGRKIERSKESNDF